MKLKTFKEVFDKGYVSTLLENLEEFQPLIFNDHDLVFDVSAERKKEFELSNLEIARLLKNNLPKYVFGQNHVIEKIVDYFKNKVVKQEGPRAIFFFLGPSATGKTFLAKTIGKLLPGYKFFEVDMTQFPKEEDGAHFLFGGDHGFANSSPGELTTFVLNNPKSVIVFDEIEKTNPRIQSTLLKMLNEGKMEDRCGWIIKDGKYEGFNGLYANKAEADGRDYPKKPEITEVDFTETIVIFTSNAGKELYNSKFFWDLVKNDYKKAEQMIIDVLRKEKDNEYSYSINPSLLSRLQQGEILLFKKLKFEHILKITKDVFAKYRRGFLREFNFLVKGLNSLVYSILVLNYAPRIDVRKIKSKIASDFLDKVTDYILENNISTDTKREIVIEVSEEVKEFFNKEIKPLIKKDIIKYMFRKNLTLNIEKELEYIDGRFIYKINKIYFDKVVSLSDYGEDGLIFEVPDISFEDIVGHKKVKQRLKEVVNFLKNPETLKSFGIDVPKGMLLYGPPGTGKTMLAKALANEADLPFIATTGTDLMDIEKIDKIFDTAKEYAPSIVFIDEIDAVGRRDSGNNREIVVNKLLSKIQGFKDDEDVFVIAATNHPENIDEAILRSGRIDLHFEVSMLDKEARGYFIEKILTHFKTKGKFNKDKLIILTTGMSGADLEKVKREIAYEMIRKNIKYLDERLFIEMINYVQFGEKVENINIKKTLEITAYHEAGHAVVSKILKPDVKIAQISIVPRKYTLGFVSYERQNQINYTKEDIKKELQILLAGRFTEMKKYGKEKIDSGANNDLEKATELVLTAILKFGMDDEIGNISIKDDNLIEYLKDAEIRKRVNHWLKEAERNVSKIIENIFDKIEKVAKKLLDEEILWDEEIAKIIF